MLVDATPEAIAEDPGVKAGFAVSSAIAAALQALSAVGLPRFLLRANAMPLYPEQKVFRQDVTADGYRRWQDGVCRSIAGATAAELRSVLPSVDDARRAPHRTSEPAFMALPVVVLASSAFGDKWLAWQRELSERATDHVFAATGTRSHNIHMRHPDRVVDAIRQVAQQTNSDQT